jgi:dihydrolipoamide dehydrogenase
MVVGEFTTEVDTVVIGGGPGGYTAAIRAAQLGKQVLLIEKEKLGGVCLNEGCIPSKTLISAASQFARLPQLATLGMDVQCVNFDFSTLQQWKQNKVVDQLTNGVAQLCKANKIEILHGYATFTNRHGIRVSTEYKTEKFRFQQAIIATGSSNIELPFLPFDQSHILSSKEALQLPEVPESLLVIGSGYIGLEIATIYQKLGSKVTILEGEKVILPQMDSSLSRVVKRNLKKLGVKVVTNAIVKKEEARTDHDITIQAVVNGEARSFSTEKVLVAAGRKPNSSNLGLEDIGIEVDKKGFILVNDQCQTNIPHVYAIGDVAGEPMLAHKAMYQGKVAAEVIAGKKSGLDAQVIPVVIFTEPEIASVGLTKSQAEAEGYNVLVGKCPFKANGRALSINDSDGYVEVIADADSKIVLGLHMAGAGVTNMISEAALAVELGAQLEDIAATIHPHPTLSEGMQEAVESAMKIAIHLVN